MSNHEWKRIEQPAEGVDVFHYTSCGLDNIYLAGGFKRHETRYGDGVSIVNVEGLHTAIGESLICSKESLCGTEIRYLRKEMKMTQEELGDFLKLDQQTVARWEKAEYPISGTADILLRALYKQYIGNQPNVRKISENMEMSGAHSAPREMVFRAAA